MLLKMPKQGKCVAGITYIFRGGAVNRCKNGLDCQRATTGPRLYGHYTIYYVLYVQYCMYSTVSQCRDCIINNRWSILQYVLPDILTESMNILISINI
jgi:hypothetical protein